MPGVGITVTIIVPPPPQVVVGVNVYVAVLWLLTGKGDHVPDTPLELAGKLGAVCPWQIGGGFVKVGETDVVTVTQVSEKQGSGKAY